MPPPIGSSGQAQNLNHEALIEKISEFAALTTYERASYIRRMNSLAGVSGRFNTQGLFDLKRKLENLKKGIGRGLTEADTNRLLWLQRHWEIEDTYEKAPVPNPVTSLLATSADAAVALTRGAARFMASPSDAMAELSSATDSTGNLDAIRLETTRRLLNFLKEGAIEVSAASPLHISMLLRTLPELLGDKSWHQQKRENVIRILEANFLRDSTKTSSEAQTMAREVVDWLRSFQRVEDLSYDRYRPVSIASPVSAEQPASTLEWKSPIDSDRVEAVDADPDSPDVRASRRRPPAMREADEKKVSKVTLPEPPSLESSLTDEQQSFVVKVRRPLGISTPGQIAKLQLERVTEVYSALSELGDALRGEDDGDPFLREVEHYLSVLEVWDEAYLEGTVHDLPPELVRAELLLEFSQEKNLILYGLKLPAVHEIPPGWLQDRLANLISRIENIRDFPETRHNLIAALALSPQVKESILDQKLVGLRDELKSAQAELEGALREAESVDAKGKVFENWSKKHARFVALSIVLTGEGRSPQGQALLSRVQKELSLRDLHVFERIIKSVMGESSYLIDHHGRTQSAPAEDLHRLAIQIAEREDLKPYFSRANLDSSQAIAIVEQTLEQFPGSLLGEPALDVNSTAPIGDQLAAQHLNALATRSLKTYLARLAEARSAVSSFRARRSGIVSDASGVSEDGEGVIQGRKRGKRSRPGSEDIAGRTRGRTAPEDPKAEAGREESSVKDTSDRRKISAKEGKLAPKGVK
ncbi:MAG: hypothetical protein H7A32_03550 [Deltaproteobacteria bacterium]|nr:hypothetical protein [Deltaproteobacteria bacterium]